MKAKEGKIAATAEEAEAEAKVEATAGTAAAANKQT